MLPQKARPSRYIPRRKETPIAENHGTRHPELATEQAYVDAAYDRLEEMRVEATARASASARQKETSFQGVYERDVTIRTALERARSLEIGEEALCFGRTDHDNDDAYYIGRRAVFDRTHVPLVIDWRVPSAEPFYRATGRHPLGLVLRRHFLCEGRRVIAIEDEHFGDGAIGDLGLIDEQETAGSGALLAAMERPRTGHMRDIVATVQAEQDEIIRDELVGVLAVQGGPGTGKTAVALHRAAFLQFTYRRKLEQQGMLVVGPNRRFLRYIDQVLPALGEGGVLLATLADLGPKVNVDGTDVWEVARIKGDARMARVIARAVKHRQQLLSRNATITLDDFPLTLRAHEVDKLVAAGKRNRRPHNARRSMLQTILVDRLYTRYSNAVKRKHGRVTDLVRMSRPEASRFLRADADLTDVLDAVWPMLTPQELISDLLTSRARLRQAAGGILKDREIDVLVRDESAAWSSADVPLLDEAFTHLGAAVQRKRVTSEEDDDADEVTTFGHIIVDEAQDLSPMAFRMISRRSRTGSITLVGDLAQSIGAYPPESWDEILAQLPQHGGVRLRHLTVNYRTPGPVMEVAARVLAGAAPGLHPPRSARMAGEPITFVRGDPAVTVARAAAEFRARGTGTMAVIAAPSHLDQASAAAGQLGPNPDGSVGEETIAILSIQDAKGLEFDEVIVVEPARLIAESTQGLRALYVALTRTTRRVVVAHAEPLPSVLVDTTRAR